MLFTLWHAMTGFASSNVTELIDFHRFYFAFHGPCFAILTSWITPKKWTYSASGMGTSLKKPRVPKCLQLSICWLALFLDYWFWNCQWSICASMALNAVVLLQIIECFSSDRKNLKDRKEVDLDGNYCTNVANSRCSHSPSSFGSKPRPSRCFKMYHQ